MWNRTRIRRLIAPVMMGSKSYMSKVLATGPIAYWPLNETSGSAAVNYGSAGTGANGTYNGPTLAQVAAPGGGMCPLFDGVDDFVNVYSAALAGAFNGALGSMMIWRNVRNPLADGVQMWLGADGSNKVYITQPSDVSGDLVFRYQAAGTTKAVTYDTGAGVWVQAVITWNKAADQVIMYANGAQTGATQTGLGIWSGALGTTQCAIGCANTAGAGDFDGYLANAVVWNKVLTPTEVARLYATSIP